MLLTQSFRDGESQTLQGNAINNVNTWIFNRYVNWVLLGVSSPIYHSIQHHTPYLLDSCEKCYQTQLPGYFNFTYQLFFFTTPDLSSIFHIDHSHTREYNDIVYHFYYSYNVLNQHHIWGCPTFILFVRFQ